MNPYSYCCDILPACNMSTISFFASLLEHCQCFPREDVFLILALGSVRGNTVPRAVFLRTLPRAQGVYWILWSLWIISSDINPVDSEYQEIHPYCALNIDSVKINTSLLMMRECGLKAESAKKLSQTKYRQQNNFLEWFTSTQKSIKIHICGQNFFDPQLAWLCKFF